MNSENKPLDNAWFQSQDAYVDQSNESTADSFPIFDYLQLLWFRRKLIVAVTLFVAIVGFINVNQLVPIYTATSTLMVGIEESQVVDIQQVLSRDYYSDDYVAIIEVLKSRGLAAKVVEKLGLMRYPEFNSSLRAPKESFFDFLKYLNPKTWIPGSWKQTVTEAVSGKVEPVEPVEPSEEEIEQRQLASAVSTLLGMLSIESVEWSSILKIQVSSTSPAVAALIANELPEIYMLDQLQAKFEATEKATAWLTDQLSELEKQVAESERAVVIYREQHGLGDGASSSIQDEQLLELNSQLIVARADRTQAEARLSQLQRLLQSDGQAIQMAGDVLSSPLVQQLRNQQAATISRAYELSLEYGPKHPRMLQVNAEIEDINQRVENEMLKISLGLENEVELARNREQRLQQSLSESGLESDQMISERNRESVQLRALEREANANRVLYETFLNRFKETSSTQGIESSDARVISNAEVPSSPSHPNKKRLLNMYMLGGLLLACGLVIALHFLNPGMHSPEQVEKELGMNAIGMVPKLTGRNGPYKHMLKNINSGFSESINSIKVSLRLSDPDANIKAIQVTSSVPGEGKSSLILSLGVAMVREGKKVLIIDADLRRPSLEKTLGIAVDGIGLTDYVLASTNEPDEFLIKHEESGVDFMRTGDSKYASATDIFTSNRMRTIVETLKQKYDYVLFDAPPVMAVADARVIGQIIDKTIFVVRWDKTPKKVARAAIALLRKGGARIGGVVLTQVDLKRYGKLGYGDSGYYYHHGSYNKYYQS